MPGTWESRRCGGANKFTSTAGCCSIAVELEDEERLETRQFGVLGECEPAVIQNEPMLIEANSDDRVILVYDSVVHDDQPDVGC